VDEELRGYLELAASQVRGFAEAQLQTLLPLDVEVGEGVTLGHRHVPVGSVGGYVPGGQYKLISSALMSVLTAKVAGVGRVVSMSAPSGEWGIHAPTIYAMRLAGVDEIYALGGVQAMAAMAYGALEGLEPVDMLVGAGNVYVAEAKRQLFGRVGIDLIAGPTEILVIADEGARPRVVAVDLLGQAEHGPTSPAVLVTTSQRLGELVLSEIVALLENWPTAEVTRRAWRDYGTVVVAEDVEEAIALSDGFAPEHLELQVEDSEPYEEGLSNYGSLFVGEGTTVPFGDKVVGTNHTLPTSGAARYTGGLWVGKFIKTLTYQRLTPEASRRMAVAAAGISRAEGMLGHAISAEIRLEMEEHPRARDLE
jgi:sulfopropanediol 3-dehydrogenase